ncbi:MAG: hypothetical protein EBR40_03070 [Proteobacteria bacterium]|nr:hypothetical protein [Pseudomonadota bacterium]
MVRIKKLLPSVWLWKSVDPLKGPQDKEVHWTPNHIGLVIGMGMCSADGKFDMLPEIFVPDTGARGFAYDDWLDVCQHA